MQLSSALCDIGSTRWPYASLNIVIHRHCVVSAIDTSPLNLHVTVKRCDSSVSLSSNRSPLYALPLCPSFSFSFLLKLTPRSFLVLFKQKTFHKLKKNTINSAPSNISSPPKFFLNIIQFKCHCSVKDMKMSFASII